MVPVNPLRLLVLLMKGSSSFFRRGNLPIPVTRFAPLSAREKNVPCPLRLDGWNSEVVSDGTVRALELRVLRGTSHNAAFDRQRLFGRSNHFEIEFIRRASDLPVVDKPNVNSTHF